jgi:hypothetical protein
LAVLPTIQQTQRGGPLGICDGEGAGDDLRSTVSPDKVLGAKDGRALGEGVVQELEWGIDQDQGNNHNLGDNPTETGAQKPVEITVDVLRDAVWCVHAQVLPLLLPK